MNIALWIVQGLLALMFLMFGGMKLLRPKEDLQEQMDFLEDLSQSQVRVIGVLEVMGAIGLILPALTGILPILTPLAAVGIALDMIGAMLLHIRRREYPQIIVNLVVLALAIFVAYGRFVLVPL